MVDWKVSLIGPKNDKSVEQTSTDYKSAEQQLALIGDWFHCRQGGSWFYYGLWPLILLWYTSDSPYPPDSTVIKDII